MVSHGKNGWSTCPQLSNYEPHKFASQPSPDASGLEPKAQPGATKNRTTLTTSKEFNSHVNTAGPRKETRSSAIDIYIASRGQSWREHTCWSDPYCSFTVHGTWWLGICAVIYPHCTPSTRAMRCGGLSHLQAITQPYKTNSNLPFCPCFEDTTLIAQSAQASS